MDNPPAGAVNNVGANPPAAAGVVNNVGANAPAAGVVNNAANAQAAAAAAAAQATAAQTARWKKQDRIVATVFLVGMAITLVLIVLLILHPWNK